MTAVDRAMAQPVPLVSPQWRKPEDFHPVREPSAHFVSHNYFEINAIDFVLQGSV
jgi:hypothetical protein